MLRITIPAVELYDDSKNEFIESKEQRLELEHSLVSLAKWESKWHKPFLTKNKKSKEEEVDYIRTMTLTQNVDPEIYNLISDKILEKILAYIDDSMTATTFPQDNTKVTNSETVTAELIYYWMIAFQIPFECQKWHLNRLLTLINVCNIKNQPKKKVNPKEVYARNKALNDARRKKYNTSG